MYKKDEKTKGNNLIKEIFSCYEVVDKRKI